MATAKGKEKQKGTQKAKETEKAQPMQPLRQVWPHGAVELEVRFEAEEEKGLAAEREEEWRERKKKKSDPATAYAIDEWRLERGKMTAAMMMKMRQRRR